MAEKIPINPILLTWARKTAGFGLDEVAKSMGKNISDEKIQLWEDGKDFPTYAQLEKLAKKYNRPLAVFFFPEPPDEELPERNFRTLPSQYIETISPKFRQILRNAKVMQINVSELNEQKNPALKNILSDLSFFPEMPIERMAAEVRKYLDIPLSDQIKWKDSKEALKKWRNIIEEHGIYIFKDSFQEEEYSGFCLHDNKFPVIYINNNKEHNRQIFTIFHELAHLLFKTGGIDTRLDNYYSFMQNDQKRIEQACNVFAGTFLVPTEDLLQKIEGEVITDDLIKKCAKNYHVSRHVILYSLYHSLKIDKQYFNQKMEEWEWQYKSLPKEKKKAEGGPDPYVVKKAYLGDHYLELAFKNFYQKKISVEQLADYLSISLPKIPKMESLFMDSWVKA